MSVTAIVDRVRRLIVMLASRAEVRYLVFGGLNTAFAYVLFTVGLVVLHGWGVSGDYAIAITVSWIITNVSSFLLQRHFVFRARGHALRSFVKFTSVTFGSFVANLALSTLSVVLGFVSQTEKLVSQLAITLFLVVITYLLHKFFSFRTRPAAEPVGTSGVLLEDQSTPPTSSSRNPLG